jgi:hypothetical protein
MLGSRRAATTGTPSATTLPQGTWVPWTARIGTTTTSGPVRTRAAWSASNVTARRAGASGSRPCHSRPDWSSWRRPRYCLESITNTPARADHQVIDVGLASRYGQVVQDRPPLPLQPIQDAGGASLPGRSPPPGDGVRAGSEPQPPAGPHRRQPAEDQPQRRCQQAAKQPADGGDGEDGGDSPGQGPGPDRPLARPLLPPPRLGRAAWPAHCRPHPHRYHRPISTGIGQELVGVVGEVGEDGLQIGLAERPHRAAGPVIVVEGPWWRTGHRGAPFRWC